jgi:S1-C subfamily serine protease
VKVLQVVDDSNGAKAGVKKDDIIISINDNEITSTDEVFQALRLVAKPNITLKLLRNGTEKTIEVPIPHN